MVEIVLVSPTKSFEKQKNKFCFCQTIFNDDLSKNIFLKIAKKNFYFKLRMLFFSHNIT